MANFVETDSPLPTPRFSRKVYRSHSNDSERLSEGKNTPHFVRKFCVRRKANGHADGQGNSGSPGINSGSRTKKTSKGESENDTIIATSYRVINTSPRASNHIDDTSTSSRASKHNNDTSTSPRASQHIDDTSTSPRASQHIDDTSTSSRTSKHIDDTSTSPRASKHIGDTSTSPRVSKHIGDTSTSPRVSKHIGDTSTSPRASKHIDETSTSSKIPMFTFHSPRSFHYLYGTNDSDYTGKLGDAVNSDAHSYGPGQVHKVQEICRGTSSNIISNNVQKPKHNEVKSSSVYKVSPVQFRRRLPSERAEQDVSASKPYTTRTGESSEDSEDDIGGHDNVVAISYKQYDLSGKCWQFVAGGKAAVEPTRECDKTTISKEDFANVKRESGVKVEKRVSKTSNESKFQEQLQNCNNYPIYLTNGISDSLEGLSVRVTKDTCRFPACPSKTKSQYKDSELKTTHNITKDLDCRYSHFLKQELTRRSERKMPCTPEHNVAILRHASLPTRYPVRWSMCQDTCINNTLNYPQNTAGPISPEKYENQSKVAYKNKVLSRDDGSRQHNVEDCKLYKEAKNQQGLPKATCIIEPEHMYGIKQNCERYQESNHSKIDIKLNLDRNDWKRKSSRFSFDNLVSICSETVANSIKHCMAQAPNELPMNLKDLALERGAAIFGGIVKEFVSTLPSDEIKGFECDTKSPRSLPTYVGHNFDDVHLGKADDNSVRKKTIQKVYDRFDSIKDTEPVLQNNEDVPTSQVCEPWIGDETTDVHDSNSVSALPRFNSMDEPKILSRRGSLDMQESSRIRLSKTGKIEVIDALMADEDSEQINEEGEDDILKDNDSVCSVPQDVANVATTRNSFTGRFNLWRLSWNLKNDSQPPSRSESLKLRLQQRRASVSDLTSSYDRRNSFSGTFNDLCSLGQNNRQSSTVETPKLHRKKCLEHSPLLARRGSVSSLSLFKASSDAAPVTRRHSVDEKSRKFKMEKTSVEKASDAFSYFFDYPVLKQAPTPSSALIPAPKSLQSILPLFLFTLINYW